MADDLPDADRNAPPARPARRTMDGRWIVTAIVALAVALGLVGVKFRRPSPGRATQPASNPAAPLR